MQGQCFHRSTLSGLPLDYRSPTKTCPPLSTPTLNLPIASPRELRGDGERPPTSPFDPPEKGPVLRRSFRRCPSP